jgi:hypothetical protein
MDLARLLDRIAERIAENGTRTEARVLEVMSAAAQEVSPGSAAALVDWDGSEIARLRAFGIVHGAVLRLTDPCDRSWLVDQILGTADRALVG